jgi:predicted transcriptional regulator
MAQKALAKSEIDYTLLKAAILGDTVSRIARKTGMEEKAARQQLEALRASRLVDKNKRQEGIYYYVTGRGERFMTDYESKL